MQRLDKLLAATGRWSRREVKQLVRQGQVLVNGVPAASAEEKYDPASAAFTVCGQPLTLRRYTYVLLHKPAGVLTATEDRRQPTVLELLPPELRRIDLAPVGRLDTGAALERLSHPRTCIGTLREGKFHQAKRMLAACGAPVLYLKRLSMGPLTLPDDLPPGAYRLLTDEEISALYRVCAM